MDKRSRTEDSGMHPGKAQRRSREGLGLGGSSVNLVGGRAAGLDQAERVECREANYGRRFFGALHRETDLNSWTGRRHPFEEN